MGARLLALLLVLSLASACSSDASTSPSAPPSSRPSSPSAEDNVLAMTCQGEGTPTVVLEAGLGTSGGMVAQAFATRHADLAIHESTPELVAAAVVDVVETVRAEAPLGPCDGRYDDLGGRCLSPAGGYRR